MGAYYMSFSAFTPLGQTFSTIKQIVTVSGGGSSTSSLAPVAITGGSVTITPTYASSQVMIIATMDVLIGVVIGSASKGFYRCLRDATVIGGNPYATVGCTPQSNGASTSAIGAFVFIDSPNTAAPVTYSFQQYMSTASTTMTSANLNIIVMEIVV